MVAPLVLNRPTRVFARLTHTGENKTSEPVCCDLSRMASIMPANPLPKNLAFPNVVDSNVATTTSPAPPSASKLLSPSYELCTEKSTAGKRKRKDCSGDEAQASSAKNRSPSVVRDGNESPPAKMVKLDSKSKEQVNNVQCDGKVLTVTEASKLLVENEKLKMENEALKDKLMFLHMILQKEENYNALVKTMKEALRRRPMQQGPQ